MPFSDKLLNCIYLQGECFWKLGGALFLCGSPALSRPAYPPMQCGSLLSTQLVRVKKMKAILSLFCPTLRHPTLSPSLSLPNSLPLITACPPYPTHSYKNPGQPFSLPCPTQHILLCPAAPCCTQHPLCSGKNHPALPSTTTLCPAPPYFDVITALKETWGAV